MKRILFTLLTTWVCTSAIHAQVALWDELKSSGNNHYENDLSCEDSTEIDNTFFIPESFESNVDSLLNSWHVNYYVNRTPGYDTYEHPYVSDSVYLERLSRLPHIIEMPYNEVVRNCIELYVARKRNIIPYMLGLADFYFPMIEQALDEKGLPLELKYLAIVESALNPTALSRAGASGLWQFMLPTGKIYGLEINSLVDERRDPVKATYAACQYFKDMYNIYGDWHLVIAAYNCGPGNVNKAIRRAGGKRDYWAIYNYLPRETRSYVPLFIAANYAMNYYSQHGMSPVSTDLPLSTDTIMIDKMLHFDQISEMLKIDKGMLQALNPQYKQNIVPGNTKARALILPSTYAYAFVSMEDTIYKYKSEEYFTNRSYVVPGVGGSSKALASNNNQERVTHKVRSGETLNKIANRYGVTSSQIKKWNGLKSNKLTAGRRLTIYTDNGGYVASNNSSSTTTTTKSSTQQSTSKSNTSQKKSSGKYKVRQGDTFSSISQKYPGVNAQDLMKMNNTKSAKLKVGQVINVPSV